MQPDPTKNKPHSFSPFEKLGKFDRSVVSSKPMAILATDDYGETFLKECKYSPREFFDDIVEHLKDEYKTGRYNYCSHDYVVSNISMEGTGYNIDVVESEILNHLRDVGFHAYTSFCHADKSECIAEIPVYCNEKRTSTGPACFECDTIAIHCCVSE